ncbi:MAG: hypothetical protein HY746_00700 [Elusimicrobia bacterium]|nr:hypothetical protein [Elusimicrobiota bacterium]
MAPRTKILSFAETAAGRYPVESVIKYTEENAGSLYPEGNLCKAGKS